MKKYFWLASAALGFMTNSCYYDPNYGSSVSYGASSYGSGYNSSLFVSTGDPRWAYDPYRYCYYDRYSSRYYDPYLSGYYPVGYRPVVVRGCPHPYNWSGSGYCPPPRSVRSYNLSNYDNRANYYRSSDHSWSHQVSSSGSGSWMNSSERSDIHQQATRYDSHPQSGSSWRGGSQGSYRDSSYQSAPTPRPSDSHFSQPRTQSSSSSNQNRGQAQPRTYVQSPPSIQPRPTSGGMFESIDRSGQQRQMSAPKTSNRNSERSSAPSEDRSAPQHRESRTPAPQQTKTDDHQRGNDRMSLMVTNALNAEPFMFPIKGQGFFLGLFFHAWKISHEFHLPAAPHPLPCVSMKQVFDVFPDGATQAMRKFSIRKLLYIPAFIFLLVGVLSSFYTVNTESVGVVQRFGRFHVTSPPGLHFKIPFSIDTVTIVPTLRQLKLEFGFATRGATNEFQGSQQPELERNMVTGDRNAAEIEWVVQYGISDPAHYLFNVNDPEATLRDISESCMNEVIGDRTVDEVLTYGRSEIESDCLRKMQATMEQFNMGIRVEQIQLKNINPPRAVQNSFDEVNRSQQERLERINIANGEYNKIIPKAGGSAQQLISSAEGYALQRKNEAQGDVARFSELLVQYEKAPLVTKQRLYLETMNDVLPKMGSKIIIDEDAKQFLPLMNLQQSSTPKR